MRLFVLCFVVVILVVSLGKSYSDCLSACEGMLTNKSEIGKCLITSKTSKTVSITFGMYVKLLIELWGIAKVKYASYF